MPNNPLVLNLTREYCLSFKQARKAVENCSARWEEYGVSIRDLTLAESIAARNEQAKKREGLVYWVEGKDGKLIEKPYVAEIPGLTVTGIDGIGEERRLAWEAGKFVAEVTA